MFVVLCPSILHQSLISLVQLGVCSGLVGGWECPCLYCGNDTHPAP